MFASFSNCMFEIATGRGLSRKLRAAMHNVIVHIIPVWSNAVVPSLDEVFHKEREGGRAVFLQTQRRTVLKNELHIYFLFPHLNYLCNLL